MQALEQRLLLSGANTEFTAIGGEFQVNTVNSNVSSAPKIAVNASGHSVALWQQTDPDTGLRGYYVQRFNADGDKIGDEILVVEQQTSPFVNLTGRNIAINADGDFVVTYTTFSFSGAIAYTTWAQRFDSDGATVGGAIQVSDSDDSNRQSPSIVMNNAGFIVAWSEFETDSNGWGIYARRFDSDGDPRADAFLVNTTTAGSQDEPVIGIDGSGNFVIAWRDHAHEQDGSGTGIFAQRFDSDGLAQGAEFLVNTTTEGSQEFMDLSMNASGQFVITWAGPKSGGTSGFDTYAQRYNADGTTLGNEFQVNNSTPNRDEGRPQVAIAADGSFAITWRKALLDTSEGDVLVQYYDSDGNPVDNNRPVNTYTYRHQSIPDIGVDANGVFTLVWYSSRQDNNAAAIIGRRYHTAAPPEPTAGLVFVVDGTNILLARDEAGTITRTVVASDVTGNYEQFLYGDFNGDGHQDVAGFEDDGTWDVWTGDGTGGLNAQQSWSFWDGAEEWQNVLTGDFNGDGMDDVAARRADGVWQIGTSYGRSFVTRTWGRFGGGATWSNILVGDFTGNGQDDIIGRNNRGNWYVAASEGVRFVNYFWGRWSQTFTSAVVGDFNGDDRADLASIKDNGSIWVSLSNGSGFDPMTRWAKWNGSAGWKNTRVGDFNGDGIDDIVSQTSTGMWWIGLANGTQFEAHRGGRWSQRANWSTELVVDMNGDGKDDLVGQTTYGHWWVSSSNSTSLTTTNGGRWDGLTGPRSFGAAQLPQEVI